MTNGVTPANGIALVLPGRRYTANHPLLYYVASVARDLGWTIKSVDWGADDASDDNVLERGRAALNTLPRQGAIVIGKSLGSLLVPDVATAGIPAVWLTPVLTYESIRSAITIRNARMLLVGGTADGLWDSQAAHASGHEVLELEGGDHRLEVPGDAVASARFLLTLTERSRDFLTTPADSRA